MRDASCSEMATNNHEFRQAETSLTRLGSIRTVAGRTSGSAQPVDLKGRKTRDMLRATVGHPLLRSLAGECVARREDQPSKALRAEGRNRPGGR